MRPEPAASPSTPTACWFVLNRIRALLDRGELQSHAGETINSFLASIPEEQRMVLLVDRVQQWAELGASSAMLETLKGIAGL